MTLSGESNTYNGDDAVLDSVWAAKRDRWRRVTITGRFEHRGGTYVNVRRNTSRRKQAIKLTTLLRDYAPLRNNA